MGMKTVWKLSGVLAMSLVLAGCGASRLLGGMGLGSSSPTPQAPVIRTGNNLALPPDLQLRPPGTVTENYQPNPAPAAPVQTATLDDGLYSSPPATPAPVVKKDIYAEYGISKTKPDGTPKLEGDLKAELKQAILKRKRETNPGYGTIRNIGNIFSDG
jgi:hypothetical protein